jgi:hypothetical protein
MSGERPLPLIATAEADKVLLRLGKVPRIP